MDLTTASSSSSTNTAAPIPKGYGKIIRDADGNIIDVELAEGEDVEQNLDDSREMDMEELSPAVNEKVFEKWVTELGAKKKTTGVRGNVVEALERISSVNRNSKALSRYASTGEVQYLQKLVDKYKDDIEAMARDRKLNYDQRTAGQLKRSLRKLL